MRGLAGSTAGGGPVKTGRCGRTGFGTPACCSHSSSDDDDVSSTHSRPNDPPYVLRGGAGADTAAAADFDFGLMVASISSIRGLDDDDDDDDDDDPTVSQDFPEAADFLARSRSSRSRSERSLSPRSFSGQ